MPEDRQRRRSARVLKPQAEQKPGTGKRQALAEPEAKPRPVVLRTLSVIEAVVRAERPLTIAEIGRSIDVPKPTVFRLCQHLESNGYLLRDPASKGFGVGTKLASLSLGILHGGTGQLPQRAILEKLVADVGETCNLTARSGSHVVYLDRVETRWPLRLHLERGSRVPLHCTASGKLFLAELDDDALHRTLSALELTAVTPKSLVTPAALLEACRIIRRQSYSMDDEEFIVGLVAIAVPVRDRPGKTIAAIACHAPLARLSREEVRALYPRLRTAANDIAASLAE